MKTLKKLFPFSFGAKDVANLIIKIVVYLVAGAVLGFVLSVFSKLPFTSLVTGLLGTLIEIYIVAGIVLTFLDYFKIIK